MSDSVFSILLSDLFIHILMKNIARSISDHKKTPGCRPGVRYKKKKHRLDNQCFFSPFSLIRYLYHIPFKRINHPRFSALVFSYVPSPVIHMHMPVNKIVRLIPVHQFIKNMKPVMEKIFSVMQSLCRRVG